MDPEKYRCSLEAVRLCGKLIGQLSADQQEARSCFRGALLEAYLKAGGKARETAENVQRTLEYLQSMELQEP